MLLLGTYPIVRAWGRKKVDVFEPIHLATFYFVLLIGIRGLYLLTPWGVSYWLPGPYGPGGIDFQPLMERLFAYSILGLLSLFLGYYGGLGIELARSLPKGEPSRWKQPDVLAVGAIFYMMGCIGLLLLAQSVPSVSRLLANPAEVATVGLVGKFYLVALGSCSLCGFYVIFAWLVTRSRARAVAFFLTLYGLTAFPLFLLFGGRKAVIVEALIVPLVCYHYLQRRLRAWTVILVATLVVLLIPLLKSYRFLGWDPSAMAAEYVHTATHPFDLISPVLDRSYGADSFGMILLQTPQEIPWQYGKTLKDIAYWWIPRAIWPGKPYGYGWTFGEIYMAGTSLSGEAFVTPTMIGELYLNFWWPGIVLGFILLGIVLRTLYEYLIVGGATAGAVALYAVILLKLVPILEGPISGHLENVLASVLPLGFAVWLLNKHGRRAPRTVRVTPGHRSPGSARVWSP